jgi:hypothetical protein
MEVRYWTENYTLGLSIGEFRLLPSVSRDLASGWPRSVLSYEYLEFGDVKWDFLMGADLFFSFSSVFHWDSIFRCRPIPPLLTRGRFETSDASDLGLALDAEAGRELVPRYGSKNCCSEFLIGGLLRFTKNPAEVIVSDRGVLKCVRNPQDSLKKENCNLRRFNVHRPPFVTWLPVPSKEGRMVIPARCLRPLLGTFFRSGVLVTDSSCRFLNSHS